MKSPILLLFSAMMITLGTATPSFAISDRNNEPACTELGNVDPRCF